MGRARTRPPRRARALQLSGAIALLIVGGVGGFIIGSTITAADAVRPQRWGGHNAAEWTEQLRSADANVRGRATFALSEFDSLPAGACSLLAAELSAPGFVADEAVATLIVWVRRGRCLAESVGELDGRPPALARTAVATVLRGAGPPARAAVPSLLRLLDDPAEEVRAMACAALGQIGDTAAAIRNPLEAAAVHDHAATVRLNALEAITRLDAPVREMDRIAQQVVRDPSSDVRETAVGAMARVSGPVWERMVEDLARDSIASVRVATARLIGRSPDLAGGDSILSRLSRDVDPLVRDAAAQAHTLRQARPVREDG